MLEVRPEVTAALADGRPVIALESALVTHGLPAPHNLEAALAMRAAATAGGAVAAMVAVVGGRLVVGLSEDEIARLAAAGDAVKVSRRDLGPVLARGGDGGTTVAATLVAAAEARIRVLATGGIGGVHRGAGGDVSADLPEIARSRVAVVCSGAKAILDLGRTLEALETLGVPVVGYGTAELPAFVARTSGLGLAHRVEGPAAAAAVLAAHWRVAAGGLVLAVPPPEPDALDRAEVESWITDALAEARAEGVAGAEETPYLLARMAALSGGRAVAANLALLAHNAEVAAAIAGALSEITGAPAGTFPAPAR